MTSNLKPERVDLSKLGLYGLAEKIYDGLYHYSIMKSERSLWDYQTHAACKEYFSRIVGRDYLDINEDLKDEIISSCIRKLVVRAHTAQKPLYMSNPMYYLRRMVRGEISNHMKDHSFYRETYSNIADILDSLEEIYEINSVNRHRSADNLVHLNESLQSVIEFTRTLLSRPIMMKDDYDKWILPVLSSAISGEDLFERPDLDRRLKTYLRYSAHEVTKFITQTLRIGL
jgi:hypothetical protein